MRILNLGSLNYDKVYQVSHFVQNGETILSQTFGEFLGGKGLNQSLALAKAGAQVYHAGAVGPDGNLLRQCLMDAGANVSRLLEVSTVSGHAVIQSCAGQNCIIVCGGANQSICPEQIIEMMQGFGPGDLLLLQNETSNIPFAMIQAKQQGMKIAFNASPITEELMQYPLELVDYFIVNETEGKALADTESDDYKTILGSLSQRFPNAAIVLTIGKDGVLYKDGFYSTAHRSYPVPIVDTTAAGDTFCGYFLAGISDDLPIDVALQQASMGAALAVSQMGAANSIPTIQQVQEFSKKWETEVIL